MEVLEGGWTVFQHNVGGVSFHRKWQEYKQGFGDYRTSFWAGNELIYQLTKNQDMELMVILRDDAQVKHYAYYKTFYLSDEDSGYTLAIGQYVQEATLSPALPQVTNNEQMQYHNGRKFSTWDRDSTTTDCEGVFGGGWWFNACHRVFLNGDPLVMPPILTKGIVWYGGGTGLWNTHFKESFMMIRKKQA